MRGQVTIFIILAIVVMIAFGFVFFLLDFSNQASLNEQADEALTEYTNSVNLKTLVQSCIRTNTRYALWLAGNQGGKIHVSQGGRQDPGLYSTIYESDEFDVLTELNVSYWIRGRSFDAPYLCDLNGPNRPGIGSAGSAVTCLIRESYSINNNLQSSISNYVNETVKECINLDEFITKKGTKITALDPKTRIVFSENNVNVLISYPFNIETKTREQVKEINFTHVEEIRLQKIYNLAYEIAGNLVTNPNFVLETDYNSLRFYEDGLIIQKVLNFQNTTGDCTAIDCTNDLIWIKDEKSELYGEPYIFKYGIEDSN